MKYLIQYAGKYSHVFEVVTQKFIDIYNEGKIDMNEILVVWKIKTK